MPTKPVAAVIVSLSLLAACGDDDTADPGPDSTAESTTTVDPAAAAVAALEEGLLTPADLDTGNELDIQWEVGDVSAGVDIQLPECITEERDPAAMASAEAKLVAQSDFKLPSLEEYVGRYEDGGAAAAFDAAAARLDACTPEFVYQDTPSQGTIERLALDLGTEQGAAWRTTVTIAGAGVAITNVHLVDGDLELALVHVDLGTPDPALLESYVELAVAKLRG